MFIVSFLGCYGALRQIKCMLGMYGIVLLLVLLAEIGIGIFAAVYTAQLKEVLVPALKTSIKDQYMGDMPNKTLASIAWDAVMYNVSNRFFLSLFLCFILSLSFTQASVSILNYLV
jgi:hypothetical protein